MRNPNPNLDKIKARFGSISKAAIDDFPESVKTLLLKDVPHLLDVYEKATWIVAYNNALTRQASMGGLQEQTVLNLADTVRGLTDILETVGGEPLVGGHPNFMLSENTVN